VLVVDDERDLADTLALVLALDEHTVGVACSGREAVERAAAFQREVVICDLAMPEMDGYGTCAALRQLPELTGTRFIVLSGYGDEENRQRSQKEGFSAHRRPRKRLLVRLPGVLRAWVACPARSQATAVLTRRRSARLGGTHEVRAQVDTGEWRGPASPGDGQCRSRLE
jgi:CheY-like chemotaxis protein